MEREEDEKRSEIDYDKLIGKFRCQLVDKSLIDRVTSLTGRPPHVFLRRGLFSAHRGMSDLLDSYERGEIFYLYTPSSEALHLGHLVRFIFTRYLQEAFKVPLVIQLSDQEEFMHQIDLSVEESTKLARENAKDIIACGFDLCRTVIFSGFDTVGPPFYQNMVRIAKSIGIPSRKVAGTFGFGGGGHSSKVSFTLIQAAPSFPSSFPHLFSGQDNLLCLIPCAIDQDPYFRMIRDAAPELGFRKPALIESSFFPALKGEMGKFYASDPNSAIYLTDSAENIKTKINSGQDNHEVGIPIKYLGFFLEDDAELEHIRTEHEAGRMLSGEVKKRLTEVLTELVERHQRARADVTDEMVDAFMAARPL